MKKLGVVFGGMSTEHDVSIISATSVIQNVNKEKYEVFPIYIDKSGNWFKIDIKNLTNLTIGDDISNGEKIDNIIPYLKQLDVIFPVLHGLYGEDGTIQGLFELINIPYVGCKVLGSALGMDKAYTKVILDRAGIKQAKYSYVRKYKNEYIYIDHDFKETICTLDKLCAFLQENIGFPMFIKPSNSGSSVGINKAKNIDELKKYIEYASQFDKKILVEENINAREVECAVLGNEVVKASCVGEILPAEEFYSFDAKYKNDDSKLVIPASLPDELSDKIRNLAILAFKAIDGKGLSRVDFFIDKETSQIYINELNTMPGFTSISMYPKLWENSGLSYPDLIDNLIELAFED